MIIHIENQTENKIDLTDRDIEKIVEKTLNITKKDSSEDYEVSVIFVSRDEIRQFNRDYRNIDRATDVISFSFSEGEGAQFAGLMLGDIVVCPEIVEKHSEDYGTAVCDEMTFVIVHGVLHLLGFDHIKKNDREKMREMEQIVMKELIDDWKGRVE
jgi:probable rRNA maturation factor